MNKLILIADSAEEGWEVVNEYQRRDLAEDSDDDKRIRQAEARAFQKRRHAQSQTKIPNFSQGLPYALFSSTVCASSPFPLLQPSVFPTAFQNPYTGNWPKAPPGLRGGSCFMCGKFGHFRSQCPVLNYQPSANQPYKCLMICEPSQSLQNRDKSLNYFPEHYNLDSYECEQGVSSNVVVPGCLKNHVQFWRSIGTSQFILDIIDEGYHIPFYSTPPPSFS